MASDKKISIGVVKPLRVYVETSVWGSPFDDDAPMLTEITQQFFKEARLGFFELYSSEVVVGELRRAPESRRSKMIGLHDKLSPTVLGITAEALELSKEYVARQLIPERYDNDALHIAIATVAEIEFLVSWNFKHIVKDQTRDRVNATNLLAGFREVKIRVPGEIIKNVD
jgi:hypothetical protein